MICPYIPKPVLAGFFMPCTNGMTMSLVDAPAPPILVCGGPRHGTAGPL